MPEFQAAEFDDELLSSYLDDELAPEERARVEERLAADPQARRLLEELRFVSRSVHELPRATLEVDLREPILRRAERELLVSGERPATRGPSDILRRFPFGRSKRAWFWAGAALAAGLMLMLIEREPEHDGRLPERVASRGRHDRLSEEPAPPLAARASEARDETAAPPASAAAPTPAAGSRIAAGRASGGAAQLMDRSAVIGRGDEDLLVVHVNVTPAAFANRAFDAVLTENQIAVATPAASEVKSEPPTGQDVDLVLVEAAPAQIDACLAKLKADQSNFLGVEVDDQYAANQRARAPAERTEDFKQYNFGVVPLQQKVELAPNRNFFYPTNRGQIEIDRGWADSRGGAAGAPAKVAAGVDNFGRAVRYPPPTDVAKSGELRSFGATPRSAPMAKSGLSAAREDENFDADPHRELARRAAEKLVTKSDMLQVLFVLQPDTGPTAGQPAAAPAPAPTSTEQGLQDDER